MSQVHQSQLWFDCKVVSTFPRTNGILKIMGPKLKYLQIYIVYGGTIELSITPGKDFFCRAGVGLFEYYSSLGIAQPLISDFAKYSYSRPKIAIQGGGSN